MSSRKYVIAFLLGIFLISGKTFAQQEEQVEDDSISVPEDWFLRDPATDHVQGVSANKTYETLLKGKPSKTVLVAVIDSGIDIEHEDLAGIIWTNEDEIPGNGIDDDKNGYIDDIHGWNFIGGKNGNVAEDTYEVTREYARLKPKYDNIEESKVPKKSKAEYEYWKKVKAKYDRDYTFNKEQFEQYESYLTNYENHYAQIKFSDSVLSKKMGTPVRKSSLSSITATNDTVLFAKNYLTKILGNIEIEEDFEVRELLPEIAATIEQLKEAVHHYGTAVKYGYNTDFNSRTIVEDDPNNLTEKGYGNNDVEGPDPFHGTHVAGIIGANRKNDLGIKGIADNVKIMSVRAVPNGDERDKDIANAIIYATNNGAKIINMSFGKSFSPNKELVDKAVAYAESKGVLLIHAAGNDGNDIDVESNYPNRNFAKGGEAKTWLEIGASSWGPDKDFAASFSNYGKKSVDVFSPGVQIYSTVPGNHYDNAQGTSMACPATAGVAAILLAYFPDLKAADVKNIIRQSSRKFDGLKVIKPGTKDEVEFNQLSSSGGLINAYEAVKLAMTMKGMPIEK